MDLTKLTQNEEIPIVETTNFHVDWFEYKSIWTPKMMKLYQLKENQETWWISIRFV